MTIFNENTVLHHATKGKIDKVAASLAAEYPALGLFPIYEADEMGVAAIALSFRPDVESEFVRFEQYAPKDIPTVAGCAEAAEEAGLDPEAIEIEYAQSGSVVAETYRLRYKEESTTGRSCGDWLAEWFATQTVSALGNTNIEEVHSIFDVNGLDMTAKWAMAKGSQGWQGRFRMNGRQVLEKRVSKQGFVLDAAGNRHDVPEDALAILQAKHAKWLAKEAKREAAVEAVAEGAKD